MIRLYNGGVPPGGYSTISWCRSPPLLAEYSTKKSSMSPSFFVSKVPLEVLHDSGTTLFTMSMHLLDPFSKKRRSPLDPVSRRTLIVFFLANSLLMALFGSRSTSSRCAIDQFRPVFFDLDPNFAYLALVFALALGEPH